MSAPHVETLPYALGALLMVVFIILPFVWMGVRKKYSISGFLKTR